MTIQKIKKVKVNQSYPRGGSAGIVTFEQFLYFVNEREQIRMKREAKLPEPWTDDIVLQKTRFTNIDRNDDFGTKALMNFIRTKNEIEKVFYIVNYRCFYSARSFFDQMSGNLIDDMAKIAEGNLVVGQRLPYQIFMRKGQTISMFLSEVAHSVFAEIVTKFDNYRGISIIWAADLISEMFKYAHGKYQPFLATEIAKDLSVVFPHIVEPHTQCPINIGAKKGLKLLGEPSVVSLVRKTNLNYSQLEHALCEFSKYIKRKEFYEKNGYFLKVWLR